jgi:integrase/recombinase XerD
MRIDDAIEEFLAGYFSTHQRSAKTVEAYSLDLRQFRAYLGSPDLRLQDLKPDLLEAWAGILKAGRYAPASIRRKFATLRVFLGYWVRRGVLDRSPLWHIRLDLGRMRKLTRVLSEAEVQALLMAAHRELAAAEEAELPTLAPLRDLAVLELLFATGIRVGELVALRLGDFQPAEGEMLIRGKGSRQRLALVSDERALAVLTRYQDARLRLPIAHPFLFVNGRDRPLTTQGAATALRRLARLADLRRHLTPHMMRHTIATLLLRNGADIRVVQEFLGHASISTTERYTHVTKTHLAQVLEACHPGRGILERTDRDPF